MTHKKVTKVVKKKKEMINTNNVKQSVKININLEKNKNKNKNKNKKQHQNVYRKQFNYPDPPIMMHNNSSPYNYN